jgi:hypothetical protein
LRAERHFRLVGRALFALCALRRRFKKSGAFERALVAPPLSPPVRRGGRVVGAHVGAGHEAFDVHEDEHAVVDAADAGDEAGVHGGVHLGGLLDGAGAEFEHVGDRVDDGATTRPLTLSTITTVKLLYSTEVQLSLMRRSTMGTMTPRRLTTPLMYDGALAMRVGCS